MILFIIILTGCMYLACKDIDRVQQYNNTRYNDFKPKNNNFKRSY